MTKGAALLLRRRRPIGDPDANATPKDRSVPAVPGITMVEGIHGAGRVRAALLDLGIELSDARQAVIDQDVPLDVLRGVNLRDTFGLVVLGSHLVNVPDDARRRTFLDLARRHLAAEGRLLVEHHPVDWIETAGEVRAVPGGQLGMVDIRPDPPFVSAVSVYDTGGDEVRQPFTARVLTDEELDGALREAGLERARRLAPTWLEATPTT